MRKSKQAHGKKPSLLSGMIVPKHAVQPDAGSGSTGATRVQSINCQVLLFIPRNKHYHLGVRVSPTVAMRSRRCVPRQGHSTVPSRPIVGTVLCCKSK